MDYQNKGALLQNLRIRGLDLGTPSISFLANIFIFGLLIEKIKEIGIQRSVIALKEGVSLGYLIACVYS